MLKMLWANQIVEFLNKLYFKKDLMNQLYFLAAYKYKFNVKDGL